MSRRPPVVGKASATSAASSSSSSSTSGASSNSTGVKRAATLDEMVSSKVIGGPISMRVSKKTLERYETKISELFKVFEKPAKGSGSCDVREVGTIVRGLNLEPSEATVVKMIEDSEEAESTGYIKYEKLKPVLMKALTEREYAGQILERADEQMLRRAFAALDVGGKGWIEVDRFREMVGGGLRPVSKAQNNEEGGQEEGNDSSSRPVSAITATSSVEDSNNNSQQQQQQQQSARVSSASRYKGVGEPLNAEEVQNLLEAAVDPEVGKVNIDDYISLLLDQ